FHAAMASDDPLGVIDQDRVAKAELLDASCDQPNLPCRMRAGIIWMRPQFAHRCVLDLHFVNPPCDPATLKASGNLPRCRGLELRRIPRFFDRFSLHGLALNECTRRLSYLAVKAAILLGVVADRSGIELAGKGGERTGRGSARRARRELLEEAKGQIDHTLLASLPSPAAAAILGHVSGENDGFKCRQNFADLHSVTINGTEG